MRQLHTATQNALWKCICSYSYGFYRANNTAQERRYYYCVIKYARQYCREVTAAHNGYQAQYEA
jgi:uncharacterized membrane protein YiaA